MAQTTTSSGRPTSYDVARGAGVTQSTVSRSFRADTRVSPATRARVLQTAARLGYAPNALAQGLATRRSLLVAVLAGPAQAELAMALGAALAAQGWQMLLGQADRLEAALGFPLAGVVSCVPLGDDDIGLLRGRGIALVLLDAAASGVDCVGGDDFAAAGAVAAALHAAGHRRILCVSGPPDMALGRLRGEGFAQRLAALGGATLALVETDFSYAGGRDGFLAVVAGGLPEAVFCTGAELALGVLDACRFTLGVAVPEVVSVVGFGDVPAAARPGYGLTTMRRDEAAMARQAAALLGQRLAAPGLPVMQAQLAAELVRRGSARLAG